jgi:hypothetical protein
VKKLYVVCIIESLIILFTYNVSTFALTSDLAVSGNVTSIYEKRISKGPQLNIGLDLCSFNYGQTVKGESRYIAMPLSYGVTANMSFPIMEELFIRPGFTYYFGGSYDSASDDTIKYSYALFSIDIERTQEDIFYGAGINYPSWMMNPSAGALFDGMPGGEVFVGKYCGGWNYELGWMLVKGRINITGSSFEQFTSGFYFKIGYE